MPAIGKFLIGTSGDKTYKTLRSERSLMVLNVQSSEK